MTHTQDSPADLLERLRTLEVELQADATRRNSNRMESLLHPDFFELGRSGVRYTREDVLAEFQSAPALAPVQASDFALALLAEDVALLTYVSAHSRSDGTLERFTLRASVWVRTNAGWRMRFHQGTPTTVPA